MQNRIKHPSLRVLVASADRRWRPKYVHAFIKAGCDVHTASDGFQGLSLLRVQLYDLVLMDDTMADLEPLEFSFSIREVAQNQPVIMIAGKGVERYRKAWTRCNVFFAGARPAVLNQIVRAVMRVRLN